MEGRGVARGEVGLASVSMNNPTLMLCQLSDTRTYVRTFAKLAMINPVEIVIPMGEEPTAERLGGGSKLYQVRTSYRVKEICRQKILWNSVVLDRIRKS
jgi:hypothetical protein